MKKKVIATFLALLIIFTSLCSFKSQTEASSTLTVSSPVEGTTYPLGSEITITANSSMYIFTYISGFMIPGAPNYIYVDVWKGKTKQHSASLPFYSVGSTVTDTFKPKSAGTYTIKVGKTKDDKGNVSGNYCETIKIKVKKYNDTVIEGTAGSNSQEEATNLFDGNKKTKWNTQQGRGSYVIWKRKKAIRVTGYTITTANDNSIYWGRNPKSWVLYGSTKKLSKNSKKWVKIHAVKNDKKLKDRNYKAYTFTLSPKERKKVKKFRYFKLVIRETKGARETQMSEFKLRGK